MSLKTKLSEELESQLEAVNQMQVGSDEYKIAMDGITKLANQINEIQKTENEQEVKERELEIEEAFKAEQLEESKKDRKSRTRTQLGTVGLQLGVAVLVSVATMVWEKTDVQTTTAGKIAWKDLIRFR